MSEYLCHNMLEGQHESSNTFHAEANFCGELLSARESALTGFPGPGHPLLLGGAKMSPDVAQGTWLWRHIVSPSES